MRVLILTDRAFFRRERTLLSRLEVGLADEGVRVLHAVPDTLTASAGRSPALGSSHGELETVGGEEPLGVYATLVPYADKGLPFSRPLRAAALLETLAAKAPHDAGEKPFDLVHCFGEGAWTFAVTLAQQARARLMIDVWRGGLIPRAMRLLARQRTGESAAGRGRAAPREAARPALLTTPDPALSEALARRVPASSVATACWGVHVPEHAHAAWTPARTLAIVLAASGADPRGVQAALAGLGEAARQLPEMLIFVDADAAGKMPLWKWAAAAGLSEKLSVISDMEGRRDLVIRADVLLAPEAAGEHRSLTLDALAAGMTVIARPDPLVGALIDGRTTLMVKDSTKAAWCEAVLALAAAPERTAALAASARAFIREHRLASAYVHQVLEIYDVMMERDSSAAILPVHAGDRA